MRSLRICSPGLRLVERLRLGEHHSGFNVYCGPAIWPHDEDALENLAHYIIRAAFSQDPPASPIIVRLRSDTARQRAAHSFSGHWGRHWRAGRMTYVSEDQSSAGNPKAIYQSKDGKTSKTFDALDWLAQLTTHIPGKNEQMVRYYGYYSNKSRGMRRQVGEQDDVPALIDSDLSAKAISPELGAVDTEGVRSRPPDMSQVRRRNESHQCD